MSHTFLAESISQRKVQFANAVQEHSRSPIVSSSRRSFLKKSLAGTALLSILPAARFAHAASGGGPLKIALIGCGGRGSGAASAALHTGSNVQLVALADLFAGKPEGALKALAAANPGKVDVPPERIFLGFDAYKHAIAAADVAIIATAPVFHPAMFEEAVRQGKHAFVEKPVATDPPGIRRFLAAAQVATGKNLKVGIGIQRRHHAGYQEAVARAQDGALGRTLYYRVFWNMGAASNLTPRQPHWTELEYQIRNQRLFAWVNGDCPLDQGVHNVDVINWIKGAYPVRARAVAGAEVRRGAGAGCLFDHFAIEYEYADGTRLFAQDRQIPGCWDYVGESAYGPDGSLEMSNDRQLFAITGANPWRYVVPKDFVNPYQREHDVLFAAIENDQPHNEAERGAMSTMGCILGRLAGYSGQEVEWEKAFHSETHVSADFKSLDDPAPVQPDASGAYPLPVPGQWRF